MAQELNIDVDKIGSKFSIARALNDNRVAREDFDEAFKKFMFSDSMKSRASKQKVKMLATVVTRKGQHGGYKSHIPLGLQNARSNFVGTVMEVRRINACH